VGTITLTLPVADTEVQAGLHSGNYSQIQTAINGGLDNNNFAVSGKIFRLDGLQQGSAADGDALVWDNASAIWRRSSDKPIRVAALAPSGSNGDVLTTVGGVPVWAAPSSATVSRKTTAVAISNSTAETTLIASGDMPVAANALGSNRTARLTLEGDYTDTAAFSTRAMPQFKLKLGATPTVVLDTGTTGFGTDSASAPTTRGWKVVFEITNLGATNSQLVSMDGRVSSGLRSGGFAAFATGNGGIFPYSNGSGAGTAQYLGNNAAAIDTTASMAVIVTVTLGTASASTSFNFKHAYLEVV